MSTCLILKKYQTEADMEDLKFTTMTHAQDLFDVAVLGKEVYIVGAIDICGCIAQPKNSLSRWFKTTKDPKWSNYVPAKVKRGNVLVSLIPTPAAVAYWAEYARKGNVRAAARVEASATVDFSNSALANVGLVRSEEESEVYRSKQFTLNLPRLEAIVNQFEPTEWVTESAMADLSKEEKAVAADLAYIRSKEYFLTLPNLTQGEVERTERAIEQAKARIAQYA